MSQPIGFKIAKKKNMVYKLKKSLYGLQNSPRQWYKRTNSFIKGRDIHEAIITHMCITISYRVESISIYCCMWTICSSVLRKYVQLTN